MVRSQGSFKPSPITSVACASLPSCTLPTFVPQTQPPSPNPHHPTATSTLPPPQPTPSQPRNLPPSHPPQVRAGARAVWLPPGLLPAGAGAPGAHAGQHPGHVHDGVAHHAAERGGAADARAGELGKGEVWGGGWRGPGVLHFGEEGVGLASVGILQDRPLRVGKQSPVCLTFARETALSARSPVLPTRVAGRGLPHHTCLLPCQQPAAPLQRLLHICVGSSPLTAYMRRLLTAAAAAAAAARQTSTRNSSTNHTTNHTNHTPTAPTPNNNPSGLEHPPRPRVRGAGARAAGRQRRAGGLSGGEAVLRHGGHLHV